MEKCLFLDCASGISGDMTVAALLDLGANKDELLRVLNSLHVDGFQIEIKDVKKQGIRACDFNVILEEEHTHHSHSGHFHRNINDVYTIIDGAQMSEHAKQNAKKMFQIVAQAESKAHGIPLEEVHFHEVGAIDSIVDIISVAVCMDNLGITEVIVPTISEGQGFVQCQHGKLPIPVPAVANIASTYHIRMKRTSIEGEIVTPTGACVVAAYATKADLPEQFTIERIGIGAGKRKYDGPGILRAMLIQEAV